MYQVVYHLRATYTDCWLTKPGRVLCNIMTPGPRVDQLRISIDERWGQLPAVFSARLP